MYGCVWLIWIRIIRGTNKKSWLGPYLIINRSLFVNIVKRIFGYEDVAGSSPAEVPLQ